MSIKTERHKVNPFIKDMLIPIGSKMIKISALGKDDNVLINQKTGEHHGTHVVARKRVDKDKFVKTFADYMAFTFDLTKAGNKALRVVMWAVKEQAIAKDVITLDKYSLEDFLEQHVNYKPTLKLSYPTFTRGLSELEKAKILAKTIRAGNYFVNPSCLFNGDRVAFTTVIERESEEQQELNLEGK
jgi:hypothetical protein